MSIIIIQNVRTHTHSRTHTHTHAHTRAHTHTHTHLYTHAHVHTNKIFFFLQLDYRMYALSFNHGPPYIREKWHIDVNISSQEEHPVRDIRLLVRGSTIFCGLDLEKTLVIEDQGDR